jgi:acyl-CoA synthetase (NDP forming)
VSTPDSAVRISSQTADQELQRPAFECMFTPRSVAVIGATDRKGSVGRTLLTNLGTKQFRGKLFAVNPKHKRILGHL